MDNKFIISAFNIILLSKDGDISYFIVPVLQVEILERWLVPKANGREISIQLYGSDSGMAYATCCPSSISQSEYQPLQPIEKEKKCSLVTITGRVSAFLYGYLSSRIKKQLQNSNIDMKKCTKS